MGIMGKNTSAIKIKATSKRTVEQKGQQLLQDKLGPMGLDYRKIDSVRLKGALSMAATDIASPTLLEFFHDDENVAELKQLLESIQKYDSSFVKSLGENLSLPTSEKSVKEILAMISNYIQSSKGQSGAAEFFIPLLSNYLRVAEWKEEDLKNLPNPFNFYWLSRADKTDQNKIISVMNQVMQEDLSNGNDYNSKIAYGFILQNQALDSAVQKSVLEKGLEAHREARKNLKSASPFGEVLRYGFEYAPLNDDFPKILEDTFPILMDINNKTAYMHNDYAFQDLSIVSNIFYNQKIDLNKRNKSLEGIIDNYVDLTDKITQVPLNQFFESLDFNKISDKSEEEIYTRINNEGNTFVRNSLFQSIARNVNLSEDTLKKIMADNIKNQSVLENLARNTGASQDFLETLMKKGNSRVKRIAEETIKKLS